MSRGDRQEPISVFLHHDPRLKKVSESTAKEREEKEKKGEIEDLLRPVVIIISLSVTNVRCAFECKCACMQIKQGFLLLKGEGGSTVLVVVCWMSQMPAPTLPERQSPLRWPSNGWGCSPHCRCEHCQRCESCPPQRCPLKREMVGTHTHPHSYDVVVTKQKKNMEGKP